ncbi:MAG: SH3 domain-containing protein [Pseudomonadota bacterium]
MAKTNFSGTGWASGQKTHQESRRLWSGFGSLLVASAMTLGGCATNYDDWRGDEAQSTQGLQDYAADSALSDQLSRADRIRLSTAFVGAMGQDGDAPVTWQGASGKGAIRPGEHLLANVLANPQEVLPTRADISVTYPLATEQGDQVLLKNSNVRLGPSTDFPVTETLSAGTGVEGLGLVQGEPWMLIAYEDRVRGYVYNKLMQVAPGANRLQLAGGPVRTPHLCREFDQSLTVNGQKDRWQGMACDFGNGWELAGETGPTILGEAF